MQAPARCAPAPSSRTGTGLFSPGMFARVRLQGSPEYEALMLPDEAIGTDQASRFVYVVGDDNIPMRRTVKLGPLDRGLRVVRKGVETGRLGDPRRPAARPAGQKIVPQARAAHGLRTPTPDAPPAKP